MLSTEETVKIVRNVDTFMLWMMDNDPELAGMRAAWGFNTGTPTTKAHCRWPGMYHVAMRMQMNGGRITGNRMP